MGDPKKIRKKYATPSHAWEKTRILEEKELIKKYGLKNKREVWKMLSTLKKYYRQSKKLVASRDKQAKVEEENLLKKLQSYDLVKPNAQVHEILEITIKDIMDRRLQTILYKKGLARSVNQARQFITHGHVAINGKKITSPSYMVKQNELGHIDFIYSSSLTSIEHPERVQLEKVPTKEQVKEE